MKLLNYLNSLLLTFLAANRIFIVKRFALNYESRIFGKEGKSGKYLRVVIPTLICFYFAIYSTLIIDNFNFWESIQRFPLVLELLVSAIFVLFYTIFWIPVLVCWWIGFPWFKKGYFELFPLKYDELMDKSQEWQAINKPVVIGEDDETFPEGSYYERERKRLATWYNNRFAGSKSVAPLLGLLPFIILILGAVGAYLIYK